MTKVDDRSIVKLMISQNARSAILEEGARIIHKKGFNHTGIKEILDSAGVPKGSFYHYFKNKEDFGLKLLDYYSGYIIGKAESLTKDRTGSPIERLRRFFDGFLSFFENNGCELGCPIGNLSQEMGDLSPAFRKRLEEIFLMMRAPVEEVLTEARQRGDILNSAEVLEIADFIINSWEGAIMRMKVQKNTEPLRLFDRMIFNGLLKHRQSTKAIRKGGISNGRRKTETD